MVRDGQMALEAHGVCFAYDGQEVLSGVDLELAAGGVLFLMGVNGCGKTTFINCLLGELRPGAGTIKVLGSDLRQLRPAQLAHLVSFVPQQHSLSFPYTVEQVVMMGRTAHLKALGVAGDRDRELTAAALASCGLEHLAKRPYTTLSGGEVQMALLARALVQEAPLIVLDEPTAHLDFRNELVFLETVERLVRQRRLSALLASHTPNHAFFLADLGLDVQVALMQEGRIRLTGRPAEVLTADTLRQVYGVEAMLLKGDYVYEGARRQAMQLAPLRIAKD